MRVAWLAMVTFLGCAFNLRGLSNTLAIDSNGRYFALGVGSRSCGGSSYQVSEKRLENFTTEQYEIAECDHRALGGWVLNRAQFLCHGHLRCGRELSRWINCKERIEKILPGQSEQPCCGRHGRCDCSRVACESNQSRYLQGNATKNPAK